jgi:hypothetical protein
MVAPTQVQFRRGTAAQRAIFTPAQGEIIVDTTFSRPAVGDGSTVAGFAIALETRTSVSDAAYTALPTDRLIAYTALTAARVVSLPATTGYPLGAILRIVDESGNCSASNSITVTPNGSDTIKGAGAAIKAAYGYLALQTNGAGQWTVVGLDLTSMVAALPTSLPGTAGVLWVENGALSFS